jgi:hypothetical protein
MVGDKCNPVRTHFPSLGLLRDVLASPNKYVKFDWDFGMVTTPRKVSLMDWSVPTMSIIVGHSLGASFVQSKPIVMD